MTDQPTITAGDWVRLGDSRYPDFSMEGVVRHDEYAPTSSSLWLARYCISITDPATEDSLGFDTVLAHKPVTTAADRVAAAIAEADGNHQPGCRYVELAQAAINAIAEPVAHAVYYQPDGVQYVSLYYHPADQPLTVDRPDPDDDLIEAMARAIVDSDVLDWDELPERDMLGYRANARAALAALREYEAGA